jgi:pimeloyl-ACP methyl ester carboxylesterase
VQGFVGRALALDVPGCGEKRGRATAALTPKDVAEELIGDIERAGLRDVVLVGHSLAGNLLPAIAEQRADLIRRLVYVSCSIPLPGQTVLEMMGSGVHGESESEVGWPVAPATTPMRERYDAMYCEEMSATQRTAFLASLERDEWPSSFFRNTHFSFANPGDVLATYVVCLRDRILPVRWQDIFATRFGAERTVCIEAGHQVMITRPHTLAEVLRHEVAV